MNPDKKKDDKAAFDALIDSAFALDKANPAFGQVSEESETQDTNKLASTDKPVKNGASK